MLSAVSSLYEFGSYRLDTTQRTFTREGQTVQLPPKTFELLVLLARSPGRAFSKHELMTALWPDTFVEEANLSFQISVLRKALGEDARLIETVPKHGYRFAADVRVISAADPNLPVTAATRGSPDPSPLVKRSAIPRTWLAAAAVAAVLIAIGYFGYSSRSPVDATAALPSPVTSLPGYEVSPSLSPDGSMVAFSWDGDTRNNYDIYVKLVGPGEPVPLTTNPAQEGNPAWSPDGQQIAFLRLIAGTTSADIFTVPALGGAERKIMTVSLRRGSAGLSTPSGNLCWTPDGKWIAFGGAPSETAYSGIWLTAVDHQDVRRLTDPGGTSFGDWNPAISRDGRSLAFVRETTLAAHAVYLLPLSSTFTPAGAARRITHETGIVGGLAWAPDDRGLVFSSGAHNAILRRLYRVSAATASAVRQEPPELLSFGDQATDVAISKSGRLVYATRFRDSNIWKLPLNGKPETNSAPLVPSTFDELTPDYSPDGRLAFTSTRSGTEEIFVANADGSKPAQLTTMRGPLCANPRWSTDGVTILFNSRREGSADLWLVRSDTRQVTRITEHPGEEAEPRWSRDGKAIYFGSNRTGRLEVWKVSDKGDNPSQITRLGGTTATESPDGRFLYYSKEAAGRAIWRVPVDGGEETPVVEGLSHSLNFVVARRGLYFIAGNVARLPASIDFFEYETGRRTTLHTLGKPPWVGMALSPDEQWLLYATIDGAGSDLMVVDRFR